MSVVSKIEASGYVATEQQIEALGAAAAEGRASQGTYGRVLLVAVQAVLGKPSKRKQQSQAEAIDHVHAKMFEAISRGASLGQTLDAKELRARTSFAHSWASSMRTFVKGGGDVRTLAAAELTKRQLAPPKQSTKPSEVEQVMQSVQRIVSVAQAMAKADAADEARALLEQAATEIETAIASIEPVPAAARTHAGQPTWNYPPRAVHATAGHR